MKQQIIVSGLGGQGVLFLTRVIAEAAVRAGLEILTSETHGMAQRGGSVLSTIKVGPFKSPLIRRGQADAGLFLHSGNLDVHGHLMAGDGRLVVNAPEGNDFLRVDASGMARAMGAPVLANLILLGRAVAAGTLFCDRQGCEEAIRALSNPKFVEANLEGFRAGLES
ncbi:2-oxoacid:acceptor oxidoreductase family protein [uncultured Desulfuromonas sp.]|uniref:2-oxoacid:acceptor oxidoreductase family protein n=1 Tax=uncultured Desulfuromonas sp. TaxID=181013 RepID=UPI002630644B|nr:2-oxoacid:acceptor oxidoreductase family protein [uncultured Desulfuromonas sp.]